MNNKENEVITLDEINPVDYYNQNKLEEAVIILARVTAVKQIGTTAFAYVENKGDATKRMIVIESGMFVTKEPNGLGWAVGSIRSPFMILQELRFKNQYNRAINYVIYECMGNQFNYIRVGTSHFKTTQRRDRYGSEWQELSVWNRQSILDDHTKEMFDSIPKYDGFTIVPNNKEHVRIVGANYNLYSEFAHKPCPAEEYIDEIQWNWIETLLKHIFGEQYEIGIKYLKVLYDNPWQALPILVLISEERQTGKTTFIDLLNMMFGGNMVVINPQDISSSFNATYADKNIIAIEESRFDSVQATEKLKNLSTQKKILMNQKYVAGSSIPFYGKIIITSNDEDKFSKVDSPEIRYWVRKIPTLKGKANHQILDEMHKEIPYFLRYLETLPPIDFTKSRMVFESVELETEALKKVKEESRSSVHKDLEALFDDHFANNEDVPEVKFISVQLKDKWFKHDSNKDIAYIKKVLTSEMKLKKAKMQRYIPFEESNSMVKKVNGRPFIIQNPYYDPSKKKRQGDF